MDRGQLWSLRMRTATKPAATHSGESSPMVTTGAKLPRILSTGSALKQKPKLQPLRSLRRLRCSPELRQHERETAMQPKPLYQVIGKDGKP